MSVQIGAGMQAHKPERAGRVRAELPVGPGEHRPDPGAGIPARVHQLQPPLMIGQLGPQPGERQFWPRHGQLGDHPQCQRQPRALLRQRRGSGRIDVDPRADQRPQQIYRIGNRQQLEIQPLRAIPRDETGQRVAAGYHHGT